MGPYKGRPRAEFGGRHRKGLDSFAEKKNGSNLCGGCWGERREGRQGRTAKEKTQESAKEAGGEGSRLLLENLSAVAPVCLI